MAKCGAFRVKKMAKAWVTPGVELRVGADTMKEFSAEEGFRYLGAHFTVATGLDNASNIALVSEAAGRCGRLHLKPRQKLELLINYILPAYYHLLFVDPQSKVNLERLDSAVRQVVKGFFHLSASASYGLLYCRKGDGGCGVPMLGDMVRAAHLKALVSVEARDDPVRIRPWLREHQSKESGSRHGVGVAHHECRSGKVEGG